MLSNNQEPTFNLKVVVRETGLKPDTLRAWERRYGLPQPERTTGGHRLYSQRDIDTLKWLVARQDEGMSISRAVDLWHQLHSEGKNPLDSAPPAAVPVRRPAPMAAGQAIGDMRQAWVSACLDFAEQEAEQILSEAFALYAPETVCFELIMQALSEIGEGWYQGEITVHQEHFASALAVRRLEMLVAATPSPTIPGRIIACCPAEEDHVFAPLMMTMVLRRRGRDVVYLGANVPIVRLETTIASTNPSLVILSAQQLPSAATLLEMGQLLQKLQVPMAYGGQVFNKVPALRRHMPGHFLGERLDQSAETVEKLLTKPTPLPTVEKPSESSQRALTVYRQNQARIEAEIWQVIDGTDTLYQQLNLNLANRNLAQHIIAALTFGNMAFIGDDLIWLKGVLGNQRIPTELFRFYLSAYRQAVDLHLGQISQLITTWFDKLLAAES